MRTTLRPVYPGQDVTLKAYDGDKDVTVIDVDPSNGLITVVEGDDYGHPMVVERLQLRHSDEV